MLLLIEILKRSCPQLLRNCVHKLRAYAERVRVQRERQRLHQKAVRYDQSRFWAGSGLNRANSSRENSQALIVLIAHSVEKGLSLRSPRTWFGLNKVLRLTEMVQAHVAAYGADDVSDMSISVLRAYLNFHSSMGLTDEGLASKVSGVEVLRSGDGSAVVSGGVVTCFRKEVVEATANTDFERFLKTRHSVRCFSNDLVSVEVIEQAVRLALMTPSVCNRQAWRVYAVSDRRLKEESLALQNGNAGFRSEIGVVLVVACDLRFFVSVGERNQQWVDGGMFSMTLVLALHSLGLGTCCLNWAVEPETDIKLRGLLEIPEAHSVIMMIAVGGLPDEFRAACSARRDVSDVLFRVTDNGDL